MSLKTAILMAKQSAKLRLYRKSWILGRAACLGQDVFEMLGSEIPLVNIQKGRIDYLLESLDSEYCCAKPMEVEQHLERKDIVELIVQQSNLPWKKMAPPKLIYMDSYSELTDQLFVNNAEWKFCCNFSDLNHSSSFKEKFRGQGLLPIDDLEASYKAFFERIRELYPRTPILFLHFPTKLDTRTQFKERHDVILDVIEGISRSIQSFYSVSIDDDIVDWPEEETADLIDFPYHYNYRTYEVLADKIRELQLI